MGSKTSSGDTDRAARLALLVPLWPGEVPDRSRAGRLKLLSRLRRALRAERQRGLAGHWSYDLARHRCLLAAYRAEAAELAAGGFEDSRTASGSRR
jgi:hypothetical protein